MSQVVDSHFECTTVVLNPMVPLNPEKNEPVYSKMLFIKEQARSAGMCCATLTFGKPLYLEVNKIKYGTGDEFESIYVRLGGFHQLRHFWELAASCLKEVEKRKSGAWCMQRILFLK